MRLLVEDVVAVVRHLGHETATIVGHDWGGAVAWNVAFSHPEIVHNLVILDLPHPHRLDARLGLEPGGVRRNFLRPCVPAGSPDDPRSSSGFR